MFDDYETVFANDGRSASVYHYDEATFECYKIGEINYVGEAPSSFEGQRWAAVTRRGVAVGRFSGREGALGALIMAHTRLGGVESVEGWSPEKKQAEESDLLELIVLFRAICAAHAAQCSDDGDEDQARVWDEREAMCLTAIAKATRRTAEA